MTFIPTLQKAEVAFGEVVRAQAVDGRSDQVILTLRSGEEYTAWTHHWTEATEPQVVGVLPSPPGYAVVEMIGDGSDEDPRVVHHEPVFGWAVLSTGKLVPIKAVGLELDIDAPAVLVPDGRVCYPGGGGWMPTLDSWISQES